MIRTLLSATLLAVFCTVAQAAPPVAGQQMTGVASARDHWLSDGLNRLVFWRAPAETQSDARSAH